MQSGIRNAVRIAQGHEVRERWEYEEQWKLFVPEKVDHTGQVVVCRQRKVIIHLMTESFLRGRRPYN